MASLSSFEYIDCDQVTGQAISPSYVLGWLVDDNVNLISKKLLGYKLPALGSITNLSPQVSPILELEL